MAAAAGHASPTRCRPAQPGPGSGRPPAARGRSVAADARPAYRCRDPVPQQGHYGGTVAGGPGAGEAVRHVGLSRRRRGSAGTAAITPRSRVRLRPDLPPAALARHPPLAIAPAPSHAKPAPPRSSHTGTPGSPQRARPPSGTWCRRRSPHTPAPRYPPYVRPCGLPAVSGREPGGAHGCERPVQRPMPANRPTNSPILPWPTLSRDRAGSAKPCFSNPLDWCADAAQVVAGSPQAGL